MKIMFNEMSCSQHNATHEIGLSMGRKSQKNKKKMFKLKIDDVRKLVKYEVILVIKDFGQKKVIYFDDI